MKPRTRLQVEVWNLHKELSEPREQEDFVISNHDFYYTTHYKNLVCMECNHSWRPAQVWQEQVIGVSCPSCAKKLKKININNGLFEKVISYSVVQVVDRFQVFRYFSCWKLMSKNKPPRYNFRSLFEEWKDYDKNKSVIVGRNTTWTGDGFSSSDYEVRQNSRPYHSQTDYDKFASDYNCPGAEFLPRFEKYGLTKFNHHCDYRLLIYKLEHSPKIETLLKANQKELLFFGVYKDSRHQSYWDSVKIVIRNKYKIKDAGIWYDYLELLKYFKKDLRNAKYVCPKDLLKEHDRLMKKKREILRLEEIENERLKVIKRQENLQKAIIEYVERNKKFFDLEFTKDNITVKLLQSVEEFKQEGDELKHCVFTNEYYSRQNSLVFSARVEGKRTETIEVSLDDMKISQSRGLNNKSTEHHNKIVDLVSKNLKEIRKIVIKTRPRGKGKSAA